MPFFKVVFTNWVDTQEPSIQYGDFEELKISLNQLNVYSVEAETASLAYLFAKAYEGLEIHSYEGLGCLMEVSLATPEEVEVLSPITIYKKYLEMQQVHLMTLRSSFA